MNFFASDLCAKVPRSVTTLHLKSCCIILSTSLFLTFNQYLLFKYFYCRNFSQIFFFFYVLFVWCVKEKENETKAKRIMYCLWKNRCIGKIENECKKRCSFWRRISKLFHLDCLFLFFVSFHLINLNLKRLNAANLLFDLYKIIRIRLKGKNAANRREVECFFFSLIFFSFTFYSIVFIKKEFTIEHYNCWSINK